MTLPFRTWMLESLVVFLVVQIPVMLRGYPYTEVICSIAVWITFMHGQVADRMQEAQKKLAVTPMTTIVKSRRQGQTNALMNEMTRRIYQNAITVECYRWSNRYFLTKEALWIIFFLLIGSYAAVTGSVLFFMYPFWRKWYRHQQSKRIMWHKLDPDVTPDYFAGVDPVGKNGPDSEVKIFRGFDEKQYDGGPLRLRFRGDDFYDNLYNKTIIEFHAWWMRQTDLRNPWERADAPDGALAWDIDHFVLRRDKGWWMQRRYTYRTMPSGRWHRKFKRFEELRLISEGRTAPAIFGMRFKK